MLVFVTNMVALDKLIKFLLGFQCVIEMDQITGLPGMTQNIKDVGKVVIESSRAIFFISKTELG